MSANMLEAVMASIRIALASYLFLLLFKLFNQHKLNNNKIKLSHFLEIVLSCRCRTLGPDSCHKAIDCISCLATHVCSEPQLIGSIVHQQLGLCFEVSHLYDVFYRFNATNLFKQEHSPFTFVVKEDILLQINAPLHEENKMTVLQLTFQQLCYFIIFCQCKIIKKISLLSDQTLCLLMQFIPLGNCTSSYIAIAVSTMPTEHYQVKCLLSVSVVAMNQSKPIQDTVVAATGEGLGKAGQINLPNAPLSKNAPSK